MSCLLYRVHQKFRISFLLYQNLDRNYGLVKVKLILGKPKLENVQRALDSKVPVLFFLIGIHSMQG